MKKKILSLAWKLSLGFFSVFVALFLYWSVPHGFARPDVPPPPESKNVRFYQRTGWQLLRYYYRIDNSPEVCIEFAKNLMRLQTGKEIEIKEEVFTEFPVSTRDFPYWFKLSDIKNGLLITGDDWIEAVVDLDNGRLYYYNAH